MCIQKVKTERLLDEIEKLIRFRTLSGLKTASGNWRTEIQNDSYRIRKTLKLVNSILKHIEKELQIGKHRGRPPKLTGSQKVKILIVKQLIGESNRKFSHMLVLFYAVSGIQLSYKSIERLYSDINVYESLQKIKDMLLNNAVF